MPTGSSLTRNAAFLIVAGCLVSASCLFAQEPSRGPDGGTSATHVSGVDILAISGKPFSASTSTDWTRTLPDGSTVTLHLDAFLARDGMGRIYRERHNFVPADSKSPASLYEIHLTDPVAKTDLLCDGRAYACVLREYRPQTFFETTPEGTYDQGTRTLRREYLGGDTIEGIYVQGTRETTTIAAGARGNDQPIVSSREFWYSDELKTNLAVTRIDPIHGKQVIRLFHISRTEPDSHLWDVPIGFKVLDLRASSGSSSAQPVATFGSSLTGRGGAEILSDTEGVDFTDYLKGWYEITQATWDALVPDEARKPILRKGVVVIRFEILPDGHLKSNSMTLEGRSGDAALDRAAWGAVTGASYPPLPSGFRGPYLELRATFLYNVQPHH